MNNSLRKSFCIFYMLRPGREILSGSVSESDQHGLDADPDPALYLNAASDLPPDPAFPRLSPKSFLTYEIRLSGKKCFSLS
jgi:hypothetical protein